MKEVIEENQSFAAVELKIYDGDRLLVRGLFDQNKIVIGRILSADFRVSHPKISRIHALIEKIDDSYLRLTDLASTHGTFVGGQRIVERVLKDGDQVNLAGLLLKVHYIRGNDKTDETPLNEQKLTTTEIPFPATVKIPNPELSLAGLQAAGFDIPKRRDPRKNIQAPVEPEIIQDEEKNEDHLKKKELTAISSLKYTARSRGVLDPAGTADELEVTVYWEETTLHVDHYSSGNRDIYLGGNKKCRYIIPGNILPEEFLFVKNHAKNVELFLHANMKGSVRVNGKMQNIADILMLGQNSVSLSGHDLAKISIGNVNFFIMFVPKPPKLPLAPFFDQGGLYWTLQLSLAILAALLLSLGMALTNPIDGQVKEIPERIKKVIVKNFKLKQKKIKKIQAQKAGTNAKSKKKVTKTGGNAGEGAKEKGAEGKRGKKTAKKKSGIQNRPKVAKNKKVVDAPKKAKSKPSKSKKVTKKVPKKIDVLETLKRSGLGLKIAKATGSGGAAGNDPLDKALSGVGGGRNSSVGAGGSGLKSSGSGGGGKAVGVGGLGSKGFGGGASGSGIGSIPGKGEAIVGVESSGVSILGGLTRDQIKRVIDARQGEIKYCYQRALSKNPSLSGKISFKWTIARGGSVKGPRVMSNTTRDKQLAGCIRSRLSRWRFPNPPGGSQAVVTWPWVFTPKS